MRYPFRISAFVFVIMLLVFQAVDLSAQDDEFDDESPYAAGLIATFAGSDGMKHRRVDEIIAFDWGPAAADQRLSPGKFSIDWRGRLVCQSSGEYRLALFAAGKVRVRLAGQTVLDGESDTPRWFESQPLKLSFGEHPLDVAYQKTSDQARIALFWSGPRFTLEPVSARWLVHEREAAPLGGFERGRLLARAHRCAACHEYPGAGAALPAPALDRLAGAISPRWVAEHLTAKPTEDATESDRRMPYLGLAPADARAIAAYLTHGAADPALAKAPVGNAKQGRRALNTLGCRACHTVAGLGSRGLFSGGDLSQIAAKRPPGYFERWLAEPASLNPQHRMPVFRLEEKSRRDLAHYLAQLGPAESAAGDLESAPDEADITRGRQLVGQHRCRACHGLPGDAAQEFPPVDAARLTNDSNWAAGCASGESQPGQPCYVLSTGDRAALQSYISAARNSVSAEPSLAGRMALAERNCLACHTRDTTIGLSDLLPELAERYESLAPILSALNPPALNSVGDKLHNKAIRTAITKPTGEHRPWLHVQMPTFNLSEAEVDAIVHHLVAADRIPERPATEPQATPDVLEFAGRRLVTTDGFGCASCHQIGDWMPEKVDLKARGPDLAELNQRIRRGWYDRWVRNPARIVPRMEMPAVQVPVQGVLDGHLDVQLAAVWRVLTKRGFTPPRTGAIRVVRRRNDPATPEPAVVMTDNLDASGHKFVKPLLIALPNRHNVLFDVQRQQLAGWWVGDAANQRMKSKYWYWQAAGRQMIAAEEASPELVLHHAGRTYVPRIDAALPPPIDQFEHDRGGIVFQTRLEFVPENTANHGDSAETIRVDVRQTFLPREETDTGLSGYKRTIVLSGLPEATSATLRPLPPAAQESLRPSDDHKTLASDGGPAPRRVFADEGKFDIQGRITLNAAQGKVTFALDYRADFPVDRILTPVVPAPPGRAVELTNIPGFKAQQLGLSAEVMPTALGWRRDGRLLFTSLKGRLWQATDSDGDELEDRLTQLGDEFVAPYGVATTTLPDGREAIDLVDKIALYRLYDAQDDGQVERTETLATGWGHSDDYHGWVVGLPRDQHGNYYLAVSQRRGPEAHQRGEVLRVSPRAPTADNPRRYESEVLSIGSRYPVGIARNAQGALFVPDNQGNYNPFNELNHVRPGRHFGFISESYGKQRNAQPKTGPSIAIPHPWTRSVNGICFLDTPPALRKKLGRDLFGPYEGHLIGCEYDTRRLIRMSLVEVDGRYEGAAYPLSVETAGDQAGLLGPINVAIAPDGDVYVANLRDAAWGGGRNTGNLVRMRFTGELPPGILTVRRAEQGLHIDFATPLDRQQAANPANYAIESFRRVATPAYGGKDKDRRQEKIAELSLSDDARRVTLRLAELRPGHVYELRVKNLAGPETPLHPDLAYYTLGPIPQ